MAYDKSPNKNAASTSPRAASRANARDTFHAGAPYSCHVTESSSVPRPMSANIANEKGRYEDDRFEDARGVDEEDRPVVFAVSSVSRSSPRGTASHASGASTAGNLPPASSKSSYATVRPGGAPTILATCVYPGCLHPTPSAGEPHRSSRANVVVVAGDSTASSGEPGSHHRRRGYGSRRDRCSTPPRGSKTRTRRRSSRVLVVEKIVSVSVSAGRRRFRGQDDDAGFSRSVRFGNGDARRSARRRRRVARGPVAIPVASPSRRRTRRRRGRLARTRGARERRRRSR